MYLPNISNILFKISRLTGCYAVYLPMGEDAAEGEEPGADVGRKIVFSEEVG